MIVSFEQMLEKAKHGEPMVLAGAAAQDADTIKAMAAAEKAGMKYAVALSACTAALHLCVKSAGQTPTLQAA